MLVKREYKLTTRVLRKGEGGGRTWHVGTKDLQNLSSYFRIVMSGQQLYVLE